MAKRLMIAIDPASGASSLPGWAIYEDDKLKSSGVIPVASKKPVQFRLQQIRDFCLALGEFDVLVIERIRGQRAHNSLKWSIGAIVASINSKKLVEMPVSTWKKHAHEGWVKGDESDAIAIGHAAIKLGMI